MTSCVDPIRPRGFSGTPVTETSLQFMEVRRGKGKNDGKSREEGTRSREGLYVFGTRSKTRDTRRPLVT